MFDRGVDAALSGLLFLCATPLLALDTLLAQLNRQGPAPILRRSPPSAHQFSPHQFSFDRAIEAYEELIDATLAEKQA